MPEQFSLFNEPASPTLLPDLLKEIRACTLCAEFLPLGPRPVLRASETARIMIVGQAPGTRVHATGIPWNDASGERLRIWLNVTKEEFYDESKISIAPMGFCYPGKADWGDLPPRKECAATWRVKLHEATPQISMKLLVGAYAIDYYLGKRQRKTLTETVRHFRDYAPALFPMPHPSPRNNIWLKKNPWFEAEIVPELQTMFLTRLAQGV